MDGGMKNARDEGTRDGWMKNARDEGTRVFHSATGMVVAVCFLFFVCSFCHREKGRCIGPKLE